MTLMAGHCDDVREAASYAKEPMTMTMSNEAILTLEAITTLLVIRQNYPDHAERQAFDRAVAALRAQAEPGPQRDDWEDSANVNYWRDRANGFQADIAILTKQRDASETQRCEWVRTARAAERRADLLERALRLALDTLDAKEAGL